MKKGKLQVGFRYLVLLLTIFSFPYAADCIKDIAFFAGIELIELKQNEFKNLGKDNYTFELGASFHIDEKTSWGIRYSGIGVELSESHLQEPSPAYNGDFTGVTGKLGVQRLYADYYYLWDFPFLKIQPIISAGLGYNSWRFHNSLISEDYTLHTASIGISGRFRLTLFSYVFVEIPCIDMFVYLYKSREPEAMLGNAHVNFNAIGGMFNWVYAGVTVPINN